MIPLDEVLKALGMAAEKHTQFADKAAERGDEETAEQERFAAASMESMRHAFEDLYGQ